MEMVVVVHMSLCDINLEHAWGLRVEWHLRADENVTLLCVLVVAHRGGALHHSTILNLGRPRT